MKPGPAADAVLPPYRGIALADVVLVDSVAADAAAARDLLAADAVGFDTESKPTFAKGEVSTGPHLVQLATDGRAYLYPVDRLPGFDGLRAVLESLQVRKVELTPGRGFWVTHGKAHLVQTPLLGDCPKRKST